MRRVISLAIVLFSCTASAFAAEEIQREFQRSVTIPAGRSFTIDHSLGNVSVRTGQGREASIHASIECSADTRAEAETICNQIQISVNEGATAVRVQTNYPNGRRNVGFRANYDIVLPENTPFESTNRFGNVTVADLQAAITINNRNGTVRLTGGRGRRDVDNSFGAVEIRSTTGDVRVKSSNGNVTVSDAGMIEISNRFGGVNVSGAGSRLLIDSANGNIDVKNAAGDVVVTNAFGSATIAGAKGDVSVKSENGSIRLSDVAGDAVLQTSFAPVSFSQVGGDVSVGAQNSTVTGNSVGGDVSVTTTFGSIALEGVKGGANATANNSSIRLGTVEGSISAKTSFGGIAVTNSSGPVSLANQNGSVTVESNSGRCQPIEVNTSFAPIRVTLRDEVGYNLEARTAFGRINTTFIVSGNATNSQNGRVQETSISGHIPGSGNCELRLLNQNGSIDILKGAK